jgi:hypothetical protein
MDVILSIIATAVGTVVAAMLLRLPAKLGDWRARRREDRRRASRPAASVSAPRSVDVWSTAVATPGSYAERRMRQAKARGLSPADYARHGLRRPSS